jgi:hypothetical protein
VKLLPEAGRYPLGTGLELKDVFGAKNVGPAAIGYYHAGDTRWRIIAIPKESADQAKAALAAFKTAGAGQALAGVGDEALTVKLPAESGTKLDAAFARSGSTVFGAIDDELAKTHATPDELKAKLSALLAKP